MTGREERAFVGEEGSLCYEKMMARQQDGTVRGLGQRAGPC